MNKKYTCPECHAQEGVNIVYGYPTQETFELVKEGRLAIGGCIVDDENPDYKCMKCGYQW